jgi:hypothetical protein
MKRNFGYRARPVLGRPKAGAIPSGDRSRYPASEGLI